VPQIRGRRVIFFPDLPPQFVAHMMRFNQEGSRLSQKSVLAIVCKRWIPHDCLFESPMLGILSLFGREGQSFIRFGQLQYRFSTRIEVGSCGLALR
jgi:hypothetical protein